MTTHESGKAHVVKCFPIGLHFPFIGCRQTIFTIINRGVWNLRLILSSWPPPHGFDVCAMTVYEVLRDEISGILNFVSCIMTGACCMPVVKVAVSCDMNVRAPEPRKFNRSKWTEF